MSWLRNLIRRRPQQDTVGALRTKYDRFRDLLDNNNRVLELIADAGEKLGGDYLFDHQYLIGLDADLAQACRAVVRNLAEMSGDGYPRLRQAFEQTRAAVRASLESRPVRCDGPLVVEIGELRTEQAPLVGEKMARLGEISGRLNLPVPEGFVITACAFERLVREGDLVERIVALDGSTRDSAQAARDVASTIAERNLPNEMKKAIQRALASYGRDVTFAVRSSALGEDGELSFAGLHATTLNVRRDDVLDAYRRSVASLFGRRALAYRREHALPVAEAAMAVGCQVMISAVASGVLYTVDPVSPEADGIVVTACRGLGVLVVEGRGGADRFVVSRSPPYPILERQVASKREMIVAQPDGGVDSIPVPDAERDDPAVSDGILAVLARSARTIERHMRCPQDVEWAVDDEGRVWILQARPLRTAPGGLGDAADLREAIRHYPVLMKDKGVIACRGIGAGEVFIVGHGEKAEGFEPGNVLVAAFASPSLSRLVSTASAVITDIGAAAGHFATIAREYRVPTILDTGDATRTLRHGAAVTVDAEEKVVYEGVVERLLRYELLRGDRYEEAPEFRVLRRMLKHVVPLNLHDPSSPGFAPERCTTYHDIIRFAHEKAVTELAEIGGLDVGRRADRARRLDLGIPLDLLLIDIGGGLAPGDTGVIVDPDQVTSRPLRAILDGLSTPGVWDTNPAEMDLEGFMSSATRSTSLMLPGAGAVERNIAIVAEDYVNLNLRLGYHFNVVDCHLGERRGDSYILFRFVGGVTDVTRRTRRASLLSEILEHFGFVVTQKGDFVVGRLAGPPMDLVEQRLPMLGRLIGFSRQLDILLRDDAVVHRLAESFVQGRYNIVDTM
jgi:pyruvate,water dikinase